MFLLLNYWLRAEIKIFHLETRERGSKIISLNQDFWQKQIAKNVRLELCCPENKIHYLYRC